MELKKINMDRIILPKSKLQFDEGEVFLLAKSIALAGLLSPVTVVPLAHSDRYEIVTGKKRFYACRMLRFKEINALVIKANPYFARTALKKGDYSDFFLEADDIKETVNKTGLSKEELSNLTAYTKNQIESLLLISSMSDLEREIVRKNDISFETTAEIATFNDIRKRTALLSEIARKRTKRGDAMLLSAKEKSKLTKLKTNAQRTPKFKDLRLFDNTLTKALQILKDAGVEAEVDTEKTSSSTEYKIKIHS